MQKKAKIGGRYLNKTTGKVYIVLRNALLSRDPDQSFVVYQGENTDAKNQIWIGELADFNETFKFLG
jgi:hypothetical protein